MSRKHELLEQYEDAFFAIMMDEVAQEEGQKAIEINVQLKEDPEAAVPDKILHRCQKTIRKSFSSNTRKKTGRFLWKVVHTAAIIVLLLAATLTISFAAFPTLRANVLNMILNVYETHTEFSFGTAEMNNELPSIEATWLPEGFVVAQQEKLEDREYIYFMGDDNSVLYVEIISAADHKLFLDTENAEVEAITVQGCDGTLIQKDVENQIIWLDQEKSLAILVSGENISVETLVQFAENIKIG